MCPSCVPELAFCVPRSKVTKGGMAGDALFKQEHCVDSSQTMSGTTCLETDALIDDDEDGDGDGDF